MKLGWVRRSCASKIFAKLASMLLALSALSGCMMQTMNSVDGDRQSFAPPPAGASQAFMAVNTIIRTNCATCHADFMNYSESDFISEGLVVPKQPAQSLIYQKLQGASPSGDMPKNAAPLSRRDLQTIRNWIEGMDEGPAPAPSTPFGQAQTVMSQSCVGCHKNFAGYQESDFVTHGYVVPGNSEESKLYYKLVGSNVMGSAAPDMPLGGALTTTQLQTMRSWIDQMKPQAFPSPQPLPVDTAFGHVQKIIGDNCMMCHANFTGFSESDFVTNKLVMPGNASQSELYAKLIGSNVGGAIKADMPLKGAPLSTDQLLDVKDWINQMPAPTPTATPIPSATPSSTPSASPVSSPSPSPSPSASSGTLTAAQRTSAALLVISTNCAFCHGDAQTATSTVFNGKAVPVFAGFTTDAQFVSSGIINAGDPTRSWLIRSLQNFGDINTMPQESSPLSTSDAQTLKTWISGIGSP